MRTVFAALLVVCFGTSIQAAEKKSWVFTNESTTPKKVTPVVVTPQTFRTTITPNVAGHSCPKCGRTQYAISGYNRDGTHTHVCPSCGQSWRH